MTIYDVGGRKQLMIDYRFIESQEGIALKVNAPKKIGTAIVPDRLWEGHAVSGFGTVMEDGGTYRLWYSASPLPESDLSDPLTCPECGEVTSLDEAYRLVYRCRACKHNVRSKYPEMMADWKLCHAVSEDGLVWTKTDLGLSEFRGSYANNIVRGIDDAGVFEFACTKDPNAPPERRFVVLTRDMEGLNLFVSADGLDWKPAARNVLAPYNADNPNQLLWDSRLGKYVAYVRGFPGRRITLRTEMDDPFVTPWQYAPTAETKTPDLYNVIYLTDELPTVMDTDEADLQKTDVMSQCVIPYDEAEDVYLAFPGLFRHYPGPGRDEPGRENHRYFRNANNGPLEVQLFVSRDGRWFQRPERVPYVPVGLEGEKDGGCVYNMLHGMIRKGNRIYMYYTSREVMHAPVEYRDVRVPGLGQIGILELEADRFVGAEAAGFGTILTPPLRYDGERLELNIDCGALGEAHVELRDANNAPIPGFAMSDCDPIDMNALRHTVSWRGQTDIGRFSGQMVRLRFRMRRCRLYGFQFTRAGGGEGSA